jgi:excisionase family DNA binding protein
VSGDRLVTAREVAELLGVTTETVLRKWRAGILPGFRLFGETGPLRFRESEIEELLESWRRAA